MAAAGTEETAAASEEAEEEGASGGETVEDTRWVEGNETSIGIIWSFSDVE